MLAAEIQTVNDLVDSCENGVVTSCVEPMLPHCIVRVHIESGFAITVPDKDCLSWFSWRENHEKLRGFGARRLRNHCSPRRLMDPQIEAHFDSLKKIV
jgi:hypothetical protein